MADKINEQLSALVDGENQQAELDLLFRRLSQDSDLRNHWERYHLISDALRQHLPEAMPSGFSQRVMDAIQEEDTVADSEMPPLDAAKDSTNAWLKPLVGFALAASVAMIAVVNFPTPETATPQSSRLVAMVDGAELNAPVAVPTLPELDERLSAYLVNHSEYVSMNGVNGVIPYARMVGYQTQR